MGFEVWVVCCTIGLVSIMLQRRSNAILKGKRNTMAYDPEARETSNNAMIIGVVALVLVVLSALAYYATRPGETPTTTVVTQPTERVIEKTTEVPVNQAPTTVVVPAAPATAPATRTIERNTTTVVTPAAPAAPVKGGDTNVTVNTPATKAPAGDGAASGSSSTTTTDSPAPSPKY